LRLEAGVAPDHRPRHYDFRVLAAWHRDSGLRLERVCADAELSYSYLRALLAGTATDPSVRLLGRLAGVYGRSVDELFTADAPAGAR
jgi:transcriptional regulator with XRE-family HTH domain